MGVQYESATQRIQNRALKLFEFQEQQNINTFWWNNPIWENWINC